MATTSLKLSENLRSTVALIAQEEGVTPHAFMVEAINRAAVLATQRQKLIAEAQAAGGTAAGIDPDQLAADLPAGASLLLDVLTIWFLAVNSHVLRLATGLGYFGAGLLALLCVTNIVLLVAFAGPLLRVLFGGA